METGFEGVDWVEGEVNGRACESSGLLFGVSPGIVRLNEDQLPEEIAGMESQSMGRWSLAVMSYRVLIVVGRIDCENRGHHRGWWS